MRKIVWAASLAAASLILALSRFWAEKNYLLVGIVMIFLTILPMLIRIERKNLREEELVILAVMIAIASMMAQKVVSASIDTDVQESLIDETLKEMGEHTWQS